MILAAEQLTICFTLGLLSISCAANADSQDLRPAAVHWDYEPDWSPSGDQIVFCSSRADHPRLDLFVMQANGTGVRRLTEASGGEGDCFPRWSPDGSQIAFTSDRDGNRDVYVLDVASGRLTNVSRDPSNDGLFVSWAPQGNRLYFNSDRGDGLGIYSVSPDGSDVVRLSEPGGDDASADLSSDGTRIVFQSSRTGNPEIYSMAADGSGVQRLTDHWADDGNPIWSPDGTEIAFHSNRHDSMYEIYVMQSDGSGVRRLTNSHNWDLDAKWSPDGRRLAFHSSRNGRFGITLVNPDGSGRRRLTNRSQSPWMTRAWTDGVASAIAQVRDARAKRPNERFFVDDDFSSLIYDLMDVERTQEAQELAEFFVTVADRRGIADAVRGDVRRELGLPAPPTQQEFFEALFVAGSVRAGELLRSAAAYPGWIVFSEWDMNMVARQLIAMDRQADGLWALEQNAAAFPDSPLARYRLGLGRWNAGDRAAARRTFAEACAVARRQRLDDSEEYCELP